MSRILLRYVFISFLVFSLHASSAWAGKSPLFDQSPEGVGIFNGLADAHGSSYAEGIARYCGFQGVPLSECVGPLEILGKDGLDAASECGAKAPEPSRSLENDLISHNTAGSSIGFWHQNWGKSPDEGEHLHMWSEEYRRALADKYASERTIQWIQEREHISTTSESSQSSSGSVGFDVGGGIGPVEIHGNGGREYTRGTSRSEERSGPTQAQIDSVHQKFFDEAYKRPEVTGAGPDILCHKGEEWCTAREPTRNPDFVKADEERAKVQENYDREKEVCNSENKPDPFAEPEPQKSEPPKKPDDEEEKKKNGLLIDPDLSSGPSPLERCYMEQMERKQKDGFHTTNDENDDGLTPKQRAERALKDGVCLSSYYGEAFCARFNSRLYTTISAPEDTATSHGPMAPLNPVLHPGVIDIELPEIGDGARDPQMAMPIDRGHYNAMKQVCDEETVPKRKEACYRNLGHYRPVAWSVGPVVGNTIVPSHSQDDAPYDFEGRWKKLREAAYSSIYIDDSRFPTEPSQWKFPPVRDADVRVFLEKLPCAEHKDLERRLECLSALSDRHQMSEAEQIPARPDYSKIDDISFDLAGKLQRVNDIPVKVAPSSPEPRNGPSLLCVQETDPELKKICLKDPAAYLVAKKHLL